MVTVLLLWVVRLQPTTNFSTLRVRTLHFADSAKLEHLQIMQGQKGTQPYQVSIR